MEPPVIGTGSVAYLFTTYGAPSETFLRRELAAVRGLGVDVRVVSLWGRAAPGEVRQFRKREMLTLFWKAPLAILRNPDAFQELFANMLDNDIPSALNFAENIRGVLCGLLLAREMRRGRVRRSHAVWATMPAAAAWILWKLARIPYTMGAHAYDLFEDGGDWLLPMKLRDAVLVHCSTGAARECVIAAGCPTNNVVMIRRGLDLVPFAAMKPLRPDRTRLRIVSVGRFVEKKGFRAQIRLYADMLRNGLHFEARLVGSGNLEDEIRALIEQTGVGDHVQLTGWLDEAGVERQLEWADVFLFTGRVAPNGDRDGLPNAIAEAMAHGLPVISTPSGAIPEVISSGVNGLLIPIWDRDRWLDSLRQMQTNDAICEEFRRCARKWVEVHFDARRNAAALRAKIDERIAVMDA